MQLLSQTKFVSLFASLLVAASQGACAGDYFTSCDINADGVLSGSEVGAFVGFDADKDGEVSRKEYSAGIIQHQAKMREVDLALFASRDGNQDGRLSGTEASGLEAADQNQDGRITEAELMLGMKLIRSKMASLMPDQLVMEAKRRFHLLDTNEDNRLSGTEALGVSHYDTNSDVPKVSDDDDPTIK